MECLVAVQVGWVLVWGLAIYGIQLREVRRF